MCAPPRAARPPTPFPTPCCTARAAHRAPRTPRHQFLYPGPSRGLVYLPSPTYSSHLSTFCIHRATPPPADLKRRGLRPRLGAAWLQCCGAAFSPKTLPLQVGDDALPRFVRRGSMEGKGDAVYRNSVRNMVYRLLRQNRLPGRAAASPCSLLAPCSVRTTPRIAIQEHPPSHSHTLYLSLTRRPPAPRRPLNRSAAALYSARAPGVE